MVFVGFENLGLNDYISVLLADVAATIFVWFMGVIFKTASMYDPYWSLQTVIIYLALLIRNNNWNLGTILLLAVIAIYSIRLTTNFIIGFDSLSYVDWRYRMLKEKTGNVYGGGEIGRVEKNTSVTIGLSSEGVSITSNPVIEGKVFGAGCGLRTHGYSALVRGDATVTIQANAQVKGNVYGGGEMSTVGKYWVKGVQYPASLNPPPAPDWVYDWMPYQWRSGGTCTVSILDHAVIGPDNNMKMKTDNGPDDAGHVFGACQGVLPYQGFTDTEKPWRMQQGDTKDYFYINNKCSEDEYFRFIETLALATKTEVTIGGNAFVMGSVYGGSENGRVQEDTHVTIQDNCQIGCGDGITTPDGKPAPYTAAQWESENPADFKECASWPFEPPYAPYDMYIDANGNFIPHGTNIL